MDFYALKKLNTFLKKKFSSNKASVLHNGNSLHVTNIADFVIFFLQKLQSVMFLKFKEVIQTYKTNKVKAVILIDGLVTV